MVDILFWNEALPTDGRYGPSFDQLDFLYFKMFPEALQLATAKPI